MKDITDRSSPLKGNDSTVWILCWILITFPCLLFMKSSIFRNKRCTCLKISKCGVRLEPKAFYNKVKLYWLVKCCLQENSTNVDKSLQIFSWKCYCSTNTLNNFLFATFCFDLTVQVKVFNKHMYLVD